MLPFSFVMIHDLHVIKFYFCFAKAQICKAIKRSRLHKLPFIDVNIKPASFYALGAGLFVFSFFIEAPGSIVPSSVTDKRHQECPDNDTDNQRRDHERPVNHGDHLL